MIVIMFIDCFVVVVLGETLWRIRRCKIAFEAISIVFFLIVCIAFVQYSHFYGVVFKAKQWLHAHWVITTWNNIAVSIVKLNIYIWFKFRFFFVVVIIIQHLLNVDQQWPQKPNQYTFEIIINIKSFFKKKLKK